MKIKLAVLLLVLSTLSLSGCGNIQTLAKPYTRLMPDPDVPSKLVEQIDVMFHDDSEFSRKYEDPQIVAAFITMLHSFGADTHPEYIPDLLKQQDHFTIKVTYANNTSHEYYLIDDRYICFEKDRWIEISPENTQQFIQFLKEHETSSPVDMALLLRSHTIQVQ